jgi:hypothetical protein
MSLEPMLARIAQIESAFADPMVLSGGTAASATSAGTATASSTTPVASAASASTSFANLLAGATGSSTAVSPTAEAEALNSTYAQAALEALGGLDNSGSSSSTDPLSGLGLSSSLTASSPLTATTALSSLATTGTTTATSNADGNQAIVAIAEGQVGATEQPPGSNNGPAIAMYRSAVAGAEPGEPWCAQFASWVAKQAGIPLGDAGQGLSSVSQIWSWAQQTGRAIPNGQGVVPKPGDLIVFGDAHVGIVTGVQPNGDIDTVEGNYDNQVVSNVRGPDEATGYVDMSA